MTSTNETAEQEREQYRKEVTILYKKYKIGFKIRNMDELEKLATNLIDSDYRCERCWSTFHYEQISELINSCNALNEQENKNTNPMKDRTPKTFNDENLKVSKFDGKHCNFKQFEQLFTLTYENELYQPHEQFIAFKNLIGGFGKGVMDGLPPTLEGLDIAKNLMKNIYLNPHNIQIVA